MWNWLKRLFGGAREETVPVTVVRQPRRPPTARTPAGGEGAPSRTLEGAAAEFLLALDRDEEPRDLGEFPPEDRLFLSGVLRLVREKRIEIPLLPQAAMEINRLLAKRDPALEDYVRVLQQDPALCVEVLRTANSAYYGFSQPAKSVREAVIRLGLHPVRSLLVVTHLQRRILKGGVFQDQARWLMDLSLALSRVYRSLARDLGIEPEEGATRGLLMHVEHFILLGALGAVSTTKKRALHPSDAALLEAFRRCGPSVRAMAAEEWQLRALEAAPELEERLRRIRKSLVCRWAGLPPEPAESLEPERLEQVFSKVAFPAAAN